MMPIEIMEVPGTNNYLDDFKCIRPSMFNDVSSTDFYKSVIEYTNLCCPYKQHCELRKILSAKVILKKLPLEISSLFYSKVNKGNNNDVDHKLLQGLINQVCRICVHCQDSNVGYLDLQLTKCSICEEYMPFMCLKCKTTFNIITDIYHHINQDHLHDDKNLLLSDNNVSESDVDSYVTNEIDIMDISDSEEQVNSTNSTSDITMNTWQTQGQSYNLDYDMNPTVVLQRMNSLHESMVPMGSTGSDMDVENNEESDLVEKLQSLTNKCCTFCKKCKEEHEGSLDATSFKCRTCKTDMGLKCFKCEKVCISLSGLRTHISLMHAEYKNVLSVLLKLPLKYCTNCDKICNYSALKKIENCRDCGQNLLIKCGRCDEMYKNYKKLMRHLKSDCQSKNVNICPHCNKQYKKYDYYRIHIKFCKKGLEAKKKKGWRTPSKTGPSLLYNRFCEKCNQTVENEYFMNFKTCDKGHSSILYQCRHCKTKFIDYYQILYHVKYKCQIDRKSKICPKCKKNCNSPNMLRKHVTYCGKQEKYCCSLCPYKVFLSESFERHLEYHVLHGQLIDDLEDFDAAAKNIDTPNQISRFCLKCNETIKRVNSANEEHCQKCHSKIILKCLICNKLVENFNIMNIHVQTHSEIREIKKMFECYVCDFVTEDQSLFLQHKKAKHPKITFRLLMKCRKCGKMLKTHRSLLAHFPMCGKEHKYVCKYCPYETKQKLLFLNHRLTHSKQENDDRSVEKINKITNSKLDTIYTGDFSLYKCYCPKCNKMRQNYAFKDVKACSDCNTNYLFQCSKCNEKFESYFKIIYHIQKICFSALTINKCPTCKESLEFYKDKRKHISTCPKRIEYNCDDCSYTTFDKTKLISHIELHMMFKNRFSYTSKKNLKIDLSKNIIPFCTNCKKSYEYSTNCIHLMCSACNGKLTYQCFKCKNKYKSLVRVYHHLKVTCGNYKYQCIKCHYRVRYLHVFRNHLKMHYSMLNRNENLQKKDIKN